MSSSPQGLPPRVLLLFALLAALAAAVPGAFVDPPANDLLLHGHITAGAADALRDHGWAAFQDPWLAGPNWGYPLLHSYPHLSHQLAAGLSVVTGVDPYSAMALLMALMATMLPLACFVGGRWLGLPAERAALAALVAATLRCADVYGHSPLSYSFEAAGLGPQALGGVLGALAVGALVAASGAAGAGSSLAGHTRWQRVALAGVLTSLVVRSHLVAGWVVPLVAGVLVLASTRDRAELGRRIGWLGASGAVAGVLALGFLVPFLGDLGAVNDSAMEAGGRSYGLLRVMQGVFGGGFLDGGPVGVWTLALALAVVGLRRAEGFARGLAVAGVVLILLMAGRATWGNWLDAVPLVGRFHDQRYLLGIHLVVPWLIAAAAPEGLRWLSGRAGNAGALVNLAARVAVALATVLAVMAGAKEMKVANEARQELAAWRPGIDGALDAAKALPAGGAVLGTFPDDLAGSTTAMSWVRRQELLTVGKPLHHYSHGYELGVWFAEHREAATPEVAAALGVAGLLRRDGAGAYALEPVGGSVPDVSVVRADVLMESEGASVDGLAIAWWGTGAWRAGQHPALGLSGRDVTGPFARRGRIETPDPSLLRGLPPARGGAVLDGGVPLDGVGERRVLARADEEGSWLKVAMSWHPRLNATVDGAPAETVLLLPGHVGVRLPRGEHEVVLSWQVPPWRGAWAAANLLLVLGLSGIGLRRRA